MTTPTPEEINAFQEALVAQFNEDSIYFLLIVGFGVMALLSAGFTMYDWRRCRWKNLFPRLLIISGIPLFCVSAWVGGTVRDYFGDIRLFLVDVEFVRTWQMAQDISALAYFLSYFGIVISLFSINLGLVGIFKNWRYKRRQRRVARVEAG